jgi:BirA family transcriptional regulator, biotin operon repressor / biotin---[acetyl-CoA-carboxylase] ligase
MIGLPRVHHRATDSTNARARELAAAGAPHGTLVTADEQSAGRGRQGRAWVAAPGDALLMSVLLRELDPVLPLAAAVAVAEAVGADARIKWPNDVWLDGRKVSGILIEGRPQEGWAVLGIGVNVGTREFPDDLREIATSLALHGVDTTREELLAALVERLDHWLATAPGAVLAAWTKRDALRDRRISWAEGEGTADGVDESGALVVTLDDGSTTALDAGEVHLHLP